MRNYQPEIYVAVDRRLGWFDLAKGRHTLTFTCVGKDPPSSGYNLGIDGVVLAEVRNQRTTPQDAEAGGGALIPQASTVRANVALYRGQPLSFYVARLKQASTASQPAVIRSIGAFGEDATPAVQDLVVALANPDPEVRRAAAWALSQIGEKASSATSALAERLKDEDTQVRQFAVLALREIARGATGAIPDLCAALKDPDAPVRMTAATALGRLGKAASSAVSALAEALKVPNEEVQVLRNVAYALGDIGPPAASAIPALHQIQHLRIRYIAQEATARIQGRPVATWR